MNFILLSSIIKNLIEDLKYATQNNFTNQIIYPSDFAKAYLVNSAAYAFQKACQEFESLGYFVKVWDAYRPLSVQFILWNIVPDERYVASPYKGSRHNRGCAVDITLVDQRGQELDMGTAFDDFSEKAHVDYFNLSPEVLANRTLLQNIMEKHGFLVHPFEWWHFDFQGWQNQPVLDISFQELAEKRK